MAFKTNAEATSKLERIAGDYNSEKDFDSHLIVYGYERIRPQLIGRRVLEMGCASGVMTRRLVCDVEQLEVVDGARAYLDQLSVDPTLANVRFHHTLFEAFEPQGRYSDVIMARALEHLPDPIDLLRRLRDWLDPKGKLHVIVPNAKSLHRRVGVALGMIAEVDALSERDHRLGHHRVYRRSLLVEHLSEAGFAVSHFEGVFLKPLANSQLEDWDQRLLDAFNEVGTRFPELCAEMYAVAEPRPT